MEWNEEDAERFWSNVDKPDGEDGCWNWNGNKTKKGHGTFSLNGKTVRSHRLSAVMAGKDIENRVIFHLDCWNSNCVNPDHLTIVEK